MADDAFRDILERSIDELPDEQRRVRGLRCRRHDAGEVCRVVCTHIGVVARLHNARNLLVEPVETVRTVLPRRRFCRGCAIW
jgi:hypothetical protein